MLALECSSYLSSSDTMSPKPLPVAINSGVTSVSPTAKAAEAIAGLTGLASAAVAAGAGGRRSALANLCRCPAADCGRRAAGAPTTPRVGSPFACSACGICGACTACAGVLGCPVAACAMPRTTLPMPKPIITSTYGAAPLLHAASSAREAAELLRCWASSCSTMSRSASTRPGVTPPGPWTTAARGQSPLLLALTGEAFLSSSCCTMPVSPILAAAKSGVSPLLPTRSTSAPSSRSNVTTSHRACLAARISTVLPSGQQ
mmetsp:Transcript_26525/g.67402  ORF Transcript_26525/g.67402 Transcript_26525/m.67402 type:complete len:260 (+) Transcript_26525:253-1032(+)